MSQGAPSPHHNSQSTLTPYPTPYTREQGADGISSSELLYYNAITALPLLAVVVMVTGEAGMAAEV